MLVKYTGKTDILLMHGGNVYELHPGDDDLDLPSVPNLPHFEAVKKPKQASAEGKE